jgi:hypothetical protein
MGHDALVRLPALSGDKLEQRPWLLAAAEKEVKELVDKRVVGRKRIAGQNGSRQALQQTTFETRAHPLDNQILEPIRKPCGKLQRHEPTERNAKYSRTLQAVPIQELSQILNQVWQAESLAQRETVVFAPELITDYAKVRGQQLSQRTKQFEATR